jgi:hypothetical protein
LPDAGTCSQLGIDEAQADLMRIVGQRLAEVTRQAVRETGATIVDMAMLSKGHDACSAQPWVNGSAPEKGAPFHPTRAGAKAIAAHILTTLKEDFQK